MFPLLPLTAQTSPRSEPRDNGSAEQTGGADQFARPVGDWGVVRGVQPRPQARIGPCCLPLHRPAGRLRGEGLGRDGEHQPPIRPKQCCPPPELVGRWAPSTSVIALAASYSGAPPAVKPAGLKHNPDPVTAERSGMKLTLMVSPLMKVTSPGCTSPSPFKSDQANTTRSFDRSIPCGSRARYGLSRAALLGTAAAPAPFGVRRAGRNR